MKIQIINGPNLNLLGKREPEIYGSDSFEFYLESLKNKYSNIDFEYFQSNHEGEIVEKIQDLKCEALIINPAAYSHTSVAIADALAYLNIPVVEVHISNVHARENYRQTLLTGSKAVGIISGLGLKGYDLATQFLIDTN